MSYQNVYWSRNELDNDGKTPTILAAADSWFWYPFYGGSLLNEIGDLVESRNHIIFAVGNNGAEAADFVRHGKYENAASSMLQLLGSQAKAFLISAGGNEFAGFNDLRPLLHEDCSRAESAAACFVSGDHTTRSTVSGLMYETFESYATLISRAMYVMPEDSRIFVHNYDYAVPSGIGVKLGGVSLGEAWLRPALLRAKVPDHLHQGIVNHLIDEHTKMLVLLQKSLPTRVVIVDGRKTLAPYHWANELHPTRQGFRKLARDCWKKQLVAAGLAASSGQPARGNRARLGSEQQPHAAPDP